MIVKEKYTPSRIEMIHRILSNESAKGTPKDYDIKIDELKVVSRTSDPEQFFAHEEFIGPATQSVAITLYERTSRHCVRYVLLLKEEQPSAEQQQQSLSGLEASIDQKIADQKVRWDYDQAIKERDELKEQLSQAEEYHADLQKVIEGLEAEKKSSSNRVIETVVSLAGSYFQKNPNALSGIPLIGGLLDGGQTPIEGNVKNDNDASFESVKAETQEEKLILALSAFFDENVLAEMMVIIQHLNKEPRHIITILSYLQKQHQSQQAQAKNDSEQKGNTAVSEEQSKMAA